MKTNRPILRDARRRWLAQAGALTASSAFPLWLPQAYAESQSTLNALPRIALVIGNTNYAEAPLKNPGNDAKAIAGELQKVGFQVNLKLDAGRNDMIEAIRSFSGELAKKKGVGIFYYAGHGAQLAWKNYLIPVDAEIDRIEDMQTKTVELNSLLEGIVKAQNPMNVIILDACRDNPFGTKVNSQQRGLAQFDAPPDSLLAYATSPGNTAADGEGANGLYTENLLREIGVPEAKIEDVFKRVRLAVRRKSEGRQIPWESTSLEEDFYFIPPASVKKLSEDELTRLFNEELAIWEKIKESKEPGPLVAYLSKYPSGKFSELAQFQLDRVLKAQGEKKIEVVAEKENPFTKGTAVVNTDFKIGDSWQYRVIDLFTKIERTVDQRITEITPSEVRFSNGLVTDLLGNYLKLPEGSRLTQAQFFIQEYSVGKKWTSRWRAIFGSGETSDVEWNFRVAAREKLTVPAGTFDAFRVEYDGWGYEAGTRYDGRWWIAPGIKRPVASEALWKRVKGNTVMKNERRELVAYVQQQ